MTAFIKLPVLVTSMSAAGNLEFKIVMKWTNRVFFDVLAASKLDEFLVGIALSRLPPVFLEK